MLPKTFSSWHIAIVDRLPQASGSEGSARRELPKAAAYPGLATLGPFPSPAAAFINVCTPTYYSFHSLTDNRVNEDPSLPVPQRTAR